jgi:hypothetical protein
MTRTTKETSLDDPLARQDNAAYGRSGAERQ